MTYVKKIKAEKEIRKALIPIQGAIGFVYDIVTIVEGYSECVMIRATAQPLGDATLDRIKTAIANIQFYGYDIDHVFIKDANGFH